jgi:hypothetical protein
MAENLYWKSALTGGTTTSLDGIDGANLSDTDACVVILLNKAYFYHLDSDSGASESSPDVIAPDTNPGTKRWILAGVYQDDYAKEWVKQQTFDEEAITSTSNSVAWNLDDGQCAYHNMTENTTIASPTNMKQGGCYQLRIEGNGSATLAWNAVFKWGTATAPAEPAADGDIIIVSFYSDGTNMYGLEVVREEA